MRYILYHKHSKKIHLELDYNELYFLTYAKEDKTRHCVVKS